MSTKARALPAAGAPFGQDAGLARAALEAASIGVFRIESGGRSCALDPLAAALWGREPDEAVPLAELLAQVCDEDLPAASTALRSGAADPAPFSVEFRARDARDGTLRWIAAEGRDLREGARAARVGAMRDVSAAHARSEQSSILLRELSHRAKNLLTVIESIARQSAKSSASKDDFVARFTERLRALALSHDLLARANAMSVSMVDLIFSQLGHHWDPAQRRIALSGLGARLKPDAAQMIGMALHELSTNAAKYGALSNQTGVVSIAWRIEPPADAEGKAGGEPLFVLTWSERGGPPVAPPQRVGFGSTVIQRVAGQALRGEASLDYRPEGVRWRLAAPSSQIVDPSGRDAPRPERMRSPSLERLQNLWTGLSRGGRPPRLADMPLGEIEPKDHLILADVDVSEKPPAVRLIAIGEALRQRFGAASPGRGSSSSAQAMLDAQDGAYRRCVASARPAYDYAYFDLGPDRSFFFERLLLPFLGETPGVAHVVGLASFEDFSARGPR